MLSYQRVVWKLFKPCGLPFKSGLARVQRRRRWLVKTTTSSSKATPVKTAWMPWMPWSGRGITILARNGMGIYVNIWDFNRLIQYYGFIDYWLVVWNMNFMTFHIPYIGNVMIPTDEVIFFIGVGQPPTSMWMIFFSREFMFFFGCIFLFFTKEVI